MTAVRRPGKVKGRSYIAVRFTALVPRGSSDRYSVDTGRISRTGQATKEGRHQGRRARGGRRRNRCAHRRQEGRLIGAGVGGGAGTAVVLSTRGEEVGIGKGALLTLRLAQPVTLRVRTRTYEDARARPR